MTNTLYGILKTLDPEMILNDGANDWSVDCLMYGIERDDTTPYVLDVDSQGRTVITKIKPDGYRESIPSFVERINN